MFGFEAHRGRLAGEARMIQMPLAQIDIDRGLVEDALRGAHQPLRRFDAILLQELDRALRRQMPALLVRRAEFQGGNQLTVAFQLRLGSTRGCHDPSDARRGFGKRRSARYTVVEDTPYNWATAATWAAFGTFGRQMIQPLPQLEEGVDGDHLTLAPSRLASARYTEARPIPSRRAIADAPSFSSTRRR